MKAQKKPTNLKYVSEKRKKQVYEIFNALGLTYRNKLSDSSYSLENYNSPFKQFSMLKNEKTTFKSSSNA